MSIPLNRTAVILLASGLSRRFGWRDKLLQDLDGKVLMEHAAGVVSDLDCLARIAVCPADHPRIAEHLHDRFIIAINKHQKMGLGYSISAGMRVAMQFRPDAVVLCMADMPFIEPDTIHNLVCALDGSAGINIAHSGGLDGSRPPTAFDGSCFERLQHLNGEDGARRILQDKRFSAVGVGAPGPLLVDVDTREDLEHARQIMAIRGKYVNQNK